MSFTSTPNIWKPNTITPKDARFATVLAFLAWTFAVYDFVLFGTMLPVMAKDFGWAPATSTAINTWVSVGTFIVAILLGLVADRIGRKRGMMLTIGGTALASLATALTFNPLYLIGVRSIAGLGYSEQAINATYLNEIYDVTDDKFIKRNRGFIYSIVQGGWPIGVLLSAALAAIFLPSIGWRGSFLVATFPAILLLVMRMRMKESPQFQVQQRISALVKQGEMEQAKELAATFKVTVEHARAPLADIFAPGKRRNTIFLSLAFFLNWFGILTFSILGTTLLTQGKHVTFSNALIILILSNIVAFGGYVFHGWLGDRFSRRNVIAVAWILGGVSFAVMTLLAQGAVMVVLFMSIGLFFQIGAYSALLYFMADSFETKSRATGTTFVNSLGQIGAVVGGIIITSMLTAGTDITVAAFVVGALGTVASGLFIMGCRKDVPNVTRAEDVAIEAVLSSK
ncbi:MFS transporter [Subtercola vilae]|uniref:MFS transporter n=1 Tax=Subtercola vilae TaxID=2056433 RepID=A0A4T2BK25_9MICO|nr:MFS transporter [Subtercola vilae]TIH29576.1 MFS transporter [Subtercola vilae]